MFDWRGKAVLNRGVLIVRPKKPYLDWAASLDDSGLLPEVSGERTVYLVFDFETDDEAEEVLETVYSEVFERELFGWHTNEEDWPKRRDLRTFKEWFSIELHSVVEDLCAEELVDNEDVGQSNPGDRKGCA